MKIGDTIRRVSDPAPWAPIGFTSVVVEGLSGMNLGYRDLNGDVTNLMPHQWEVVPSYKAGDRVKRVKKPGIAVPMGYETGLYLDAKGNLVFTNAHGRKGLTFHPGRWELVPNCIDLQEGTFAVTRSGAKVGPLQRKPTTWTAVDPNRFYYITEANPMGWYSNGRRTSDRDSPGDIVGPWVEPSAKPVETLTVRLELDTSAVTDVLDGLGSVVTVGAVETTTKLVTEHKVLPGSYGPRGNLVVESIGVSGARVGLGFQKRFYSNAELRELATLLNGIADALPDPRD